MLMRRQRSETNSASLTSFCACSRLTYVHRYLNSEQFVNAIAPKDDLTKIGRAQYGALFRVADSNKRGLVSWDDFVIFETILKRPDADYYMAFQYFDV